MDELGSPFGRLSTGAAEWRPNSSAGTMSSAQEAPSSGDNTSDLQASKVKEFVPGQGWNLSGEAGTDENDEYTKEQEESANFQDHFETSVPAGSLPLPPPLFRAMHSLGSSDEYWKRLRSQSLESMRQMPSSDPRHKGIPYPYCNANYLDDERQKGRSSFGYPCQTFKVQNQKDGYLYTLRRFDAVRNVSPKIADTVMRQWTLEPEILEHPHICTLHHCFLAQRALFVVHDYIPGARTLRERLEGPLSEPILWSCAAQIVSAFMTIHGHHMAARSLSLQHVLSTTNAGGNSLRVYLNCVGIVDMLEFETRKHLQELQQQDVRDLGRLLLSLATGTALTADTASPELLARCERFCAQNYSRELHDLTMALLKSSVPPSMAQVARVLAPHTMRQQEVAFQHLDVAERMLATEYESGRALRLMIKLGFINERPENGLNRQWAESGDCYVLKLFRDYVFHQADGAGNPVMDLGHVMTALNKLDACDEERIMLCSRDGKTIMVASFADVARCLENAFHELCASAVTPTEALQY